MHLQTNTESLQFTGSGSEIVAASPYPIVLSQNTAAKHPELGTPPCFKLFNRFKTSGVGYCIQ